MPFEVPGTISTRCCRKALPLFVVVVFKRRQGNSLRCGHFDFVGYASACRAEGGKPGRGAASMAEQRPPLK